MRCTPSPTQKHQAGIHSQTKVPVGGAGLNTTHRGAGEGRALTTSAAGNRCADLSPGSNPAVA